MCIFEPISAVPKLPPAGSQGCDQARCRVERIVGQKICTRSYSINSLRVLLLLWKRLIVTSVGGGSFALMLALLPRAVSPNVRDFVSNVRNGNRGVRMSYPVCWGFGQPLGNGCSKTYGIEMSRLS